MTPEQALAEIEAILDRAPMLPADKRAAFAALRVLREELDDGAKFRNGIDNLIVALDEAPGLPIELLSEEDQGKWTNTLTGILMALGPYRITGKPQTVWEYVNEEAKP